MAALLTNIAVIGMLMLGSLSAQDVDSTQKTTKANFFSCRFEMGGTASSWLALHGEFTIYRFRIIESEGLQSNSLRVSIGSTLIPADRIYLPVQLTYLLFNQSHHLELGVAASFFLYELPDNPDPNYDSELYFSRSLVLPFGVIGYRYEHKYGGFQFRVAYTPMFDYEAGTIEHLFGISLGHAF